MYCTKYEKINNNDLNNYKKYIFNVLEITMILLLVINISIFYRYIYPDVFYFYGSDGSTQGLTAIFYYIMLLPLTITFLIVPIIMLFYGIKDLKKINILMLIITLLLNLISILYLKYFNLSIILWNVFFIIFVLFNNRNSDEYPRSLIKHIIMIIVSIIILILFPANPNSYEGWVSVDADLSIKYGINEYLQKHNLSGHKISYKIRTSDPEYEYEMEKNVNAYIENGTVIKATIEYKDIVYEYADNIDKMHYKTMYNQVKSTVLKKFYYNFLGD